MATSRAVRISRFGGPEVLQIDRVPIPQPGDNEVLVRVAAASINPVDYKIREGHFPKVKESDLPIILGRDLSGTVEASGGDAPDMFSQGDAVFAHIGFDRGAQSDLVIVKTAELVPAPRTLDIVEAAAVPLAAMTAWQGLFDHGHLSEGQTVLIHGGAGGVGHLAIQFAKAKGANVVTTVGTEDVDYARSIGADTVIDYRNERFEDVVKDVDVVFDLVGGETQARSFAIIREGGTLVSTLAVDDAEAGKARSVHVPDRWMAEPNAGQLKEIADLIDAGSVGINVAETFPLDRVKEAYERLEKGHVRGKIVLTFE